MKKVLSITVKNLVGSTVKGYNIIEFTELNDFLNDGWSIHSTETINSNTVSVFSIIYTLKK
tara:strand:+ start:2611 stop:2793 length:183 start_codon:yes stop_codon:yes gene_type:complete